MYLIKEKWLYYPSNSGVWKLYFAKYLEVWEIKPGEEPFELLFYRNITIYTSPPDDKKSDYLLDIRAYCSDCGELTQVVVLEIVKEYTTSRIQLPDTDKKKKIPFRFTPLKGLKCIAGHPIKPEHLFLKKGEELVGFYQTFGRNIEPDFSVLA